jgi:hypothetical protein
MSDIKKLWPVTTKILSEVRNNATVVEILGTQRVTLEVRLRVFVAYVYVICHLASLLSLRFPIVRPTTAVRREGCKL